MAFSETQIKELAGKLSQKHVRTREHRGLQLSYIEGWHAIDEANRVFGFDGWDREVVWAECIWQDVRRDPKLCAYAARVRIRVRAGDVMVARDGSGVGHGSGDTLGEAHESALKEAETDATKRALTTFGNLFGLALYDKQQRGVRSYRSPAPRAPERHWTLLAEGGEVLSVHGTAEAFCRALREAFATAQSSAALEALWSRNRIVADGMRVLLPTLKTVRGSHYVDVLQRCYEARKAQLSTRRDEAGAETGEPVGGEPASVDKSVLRLGVPKRIRDADHLAYVRSLPCLICARTPSEPHHLRFVQPRGMSSKPSDEWTVPLCLLHHRALHDAGSEERWWEEQHIDARAEAERLWREGHQNALPTADRHGDAAE
jgi:DNA recombination protein Rad52